MSVRLGLPVAAVAIALAAPALAQARLDKLTVDNVGQVLFEGGVNYAIEQMQDGAVYLEFDGQSTLGAEQVQIWFYACDQQVQCEDIRLWAWVAHRRPVDLALINQWNAEGRWTKAYLDQDSDPVLEMDINATGGIGAEALSILINTYGEQHEDFVEAIQVADGG